VTSSLIIEFYYYNKINIMFLFLFSKQKINYRKINNMILSPSIRAGWSLEATAILAAPLKAEASMVEALGK
jgi:hypothetical protein